MFGLQAKLKPFRYWFLGLFITSNLFISGNSLVSGEESSDLSTGLSNVILDVARIFIPAPEPVLILPESLSLSLSSQEIYIGTSNRITPTWSPSNTTDKTLSWSSSDPTIVEVTSGGIAVARNFGNATITATANAAPVISTIALTVIDFPIITDFDLEALIFEEPTETIEVGTSAKLRLSNLSPSNGKRTGITFTSSDETLAVVNTDGVVRGLKAGEVVVSAAIGTTIKTLPLTIIDTIDVIAPNSFAIDGPTLGYVGRPFSLTIDFGMIPPTDTQVTFQSDNALLARVDDNGLVTPVNYAGYEPKTVNITAYANADPTFTQTIPITIEKVFPLQVALTSAGTVEAGRTINILPTFTPIDVTDRQLVYTSSDPTIATVNTAGDFGVLLGKKIGVVTITATSVMDPTVTATTRLEILPAPILTPTQMAQFLLFVRKGIGHFTLNFINGIFGFFTFYTWLPPLKKRFILVSILAGTFLGALAESFQFFAPGRTPTWDDVVYNITGYLFAQLLLSLLMQWIYFIRVTRIAKKRSAKLKG